MKTKAFLILFLISQNLTAAPVQLPSSLLTIDTLIDQFRSPFQNKLNDFYKNFITRKNAGRTEFSSTSNVQCPLGETIAANSILTSYEYQTKFSEGQILQQASYFGCKGLLSLKETIVTKGEELKPVNWMDISGSRVIFKLALKETQRIYIIADGQQRELFKAVMNRTSSGEQTDLYVMNNKVLTMNLIQGDDKTQLNYNIYSYNLNYSQNGFNINSRLSQNYSFRVLAYKENNQVYFLSNANQPISLSDFQTSLNDTLLISSMNDMGYIIKSFILEFPKTDFVATGIKSSVVLDELRLSFVRLTNNTELSLVKILIQQYIEAIEKGTLVIQDNRPK